MWRRRYPSIFDIFESFWKGSPLERKEWPEAGWFREPFDEMVKRFEESVPPEFQDFVSDEITPVRRYGPFVYGFSYTAEPGKEPIFREFGNIRPYHRGIEPSMGREPLVDVMDEKDKYTIYVELPGVDKDKIKLDVANDSVEVKTEDDKKYYKMIDLEASVNPESTKASYKNGVLTVELEKKENRNGKEIRIE